MLCHCLRPKALLTRMDPACARPMETINVNAAQLSAIWCAACATALIVPIKIPDTANAPASIPICKLLGTPMRINSLSVEVLNFHCERLTAMYFLNVGCFKTTSSNIIKINERVINVDHPAPANSRRGKPQLP